jgi:hypothetical protein
LICDCPQEGQVVATVSADLTSFSNLVPQSSHRYSKIGTSLFSQSRVRAVDEGGMTGRWRPVEPVEGGRFLTNAASIFETLQSAVDNGQPVSDMSILIGPDGALQVKVEAHGWALDALQAHSGAAIAYRISQHHRGVRLEGRAGTRRCLFEVARPDRAASSLLANTRLYPMDTGLTASSPGSPNQGLVPENVLEPPRASGEFSD